jgi:hypothetical protein
MSGTSSSTSSSTSGRGRRSSSRPDRVRRATACRPSGGGCRLEPVGELGDPLLVGPADDERPAPVGEHLLEGDDLAGPVGLAGHHHVERLVEHDLLAADEARVAQLGVELDPHLATTGEDVDGAVVVVAEEGRVGRRRLGELLDLFAQRGDVLACLAQGVGELLVLGDRLGELALGLEQPLLEGAHPLRCVLEPPAERLDLVLEHRGLRPQVGQLALGVPPLAVWLRIRPEAISVICHVSDPTPIGPPRVARTPGPSRRISP